MRIYVASGLNNYPLARNLMNNLRKGGFEITYDWTSLIDINGSVKTIDHRLVKEASMKEASGVKNADILVALLPGGRGTHTEIGMALGDGIPVVIAAPEAADLFQNGLPCSFYYHPGVTAIIISPDAQLLTLLLTKIWEDIANV